ncbi:RrF2 family transcriptional regulator [Algoriphagus namhaensis]|uniref:RrF2 family transcriptional regulator n=1 Tax=Algoriphagus namhaensis TaxID=915353 RepID=A0ABV8AUC8_9BACT
MFSKACEYAIRSLIYVTEKSKNGERVSVTDISTAVESPFAFTGKTLQKLVKQDIISSAKGPNGGFYITEEQAKANRLADVVSLIDGNAVFQGCGLGLKICKENQPCPLHQNFKEIRKQLKKMLQSTTVAELAESQATQKTFLNNINRN